MSDNLLSFPAPRHVRPEALELLHRVDPEALTVTDEGILLLWGSDELTDEETALLRSVTPAEMHAFITEETLKAARLDAEVAALREVQQLCEPYWPAGGTLGDAVDAMPPDLRQQAIDALAGAGMDLGSER